MFRICNMTNVNTDLNASNVLRDVYKMIDVKNIARLKNTNQVRNLAWKIFKMIMNNNYYEDLSDEEAKKLYTGWLLEEGYKGGNGWAMVANELESDHWSSWFLNEKNSLGKIMNDKSKTTITVGGVTYDIGN